MALAEVAWELTLRIVWWRLRVTFGCCTLFECKDNPPRTLIILCIPSKPYSVYSIHSAIKSRINGILFHSFQKNRISHPKKTQTDLSGNSYPRKVSKNCTLSFTVCVQYSYHCSLLSFLLKILIPIIRCFLCYYNTFEHCKISTYGNRTEWSPIRSVIIRVITKSDDRTAGVRFVYHEHDYRPNRTTLSPIIN